MLRLLCVFALRFRKRKKNSDYFFLNIVFKFAGMTNQQLIDNGHQMMDETDQAIDRAQKVVHLQYLISSLDKHFSLLPTIAITQSDFRLNFLCLSHYRLFMRLSTLEQRQQQLSRLKYVFNLEMKN